MSYPNFTTLKYVAIFIFMKRKHITFFFVFILLKICFSLQEKYVPTITPPKQMQTLLIYR